jgi:hypothetical protein
VASASVTGDASSSWACRLFDGTEAPGAGGALDASLITMQVGPNGEPVEGVVLGSATYTANVTITLGCGVPTGSPTPDQAGSASNSQVLALKVGTESH